MNIVHRSEYCTFTVSALENVVLLRHLVCDKSQVYDCEVCIGEIGYSVVCDALYAGPHPKPAGCRVLQLSAILAIVLLIPIMYHCILN